MNTDLQKVHKSKCAFSGLEGAIEYIGGIIAQEKFNYEISRKARIYKKFTEVDVRFSLLNLQYIYEGINIMPLMNLEN